MTISPQQRARGALLGLAIGDALGMPTQTLSRQVVAKRYGLLSEFAPGPEDNPISRGLPAGRVTDDTDQAVIIGRLLVRGRGRIDPERLANELLRWEERMIAAGSADLLGPSTRKALTLAAQGVSTEMTGRGGATNGAAMRVAPVGVAFSCDPVERLIDAVVQTGLVTHNTTLANAGAAAIAAAVSAGVGGADVADALAHAVEAAKLGAKRGFYVAGADVASRIAWALDLVEGKNAEDAVEIIYRLVGTGLPTQEAVPAALAICAIAPEDPWFACRLAASLGGDCDTIAAMAGAVVGACHGVDAFPLEKVEQLRAANPDMALDDLADDLLALRMDARDAEARRA